MSLLRRFKEPAFAANTSVKASELNGEFNNIINGLNGQSDISVTNVTSTGTLSTDLGTVFSNTLNVVSSTTFSGTVTLGANTTVGGVNLGEFCAPIGSIIAFYDYDGDLTFNSSIWAYCNGQAKTINSVSETLPDLSNRYIVGFGTEAGTDIDTAAWGTAAVGSASHAENVSHTHTGAPHTHTGYAHTHSSGRFYNSGSAYGVQLYTGTYGGSNNLLIGGVPSVVAIGNGGTTEFVIATEKNGTIADDDPIITGSAGTEQTESTTPENTTAAGSETQDIQPRSIRVRYLMRYA